MVWRCLLVPGDISLADLHQVLQITCGRYRIFVEESLSRACSRSYFRQNRSCGRMTSGSGCLPSVKEYESGAFAVAVVTLDT
ncbi:MAG: hypothetical protein JOY85_02970 [Acidobacteriaceae bacterium]|nr:hypothetical protein [Acidobacteriaceae bacterium]